MLGWSFYSQGSKERATAADAFLDWALAKLGVKLETTSASAKGEAIAEALMARRALLVLDGVEPLQHGPGPQTGQLKDQGLRALLRRFAAAPPRADHSLIVLTSRLAVADLQRFKSGAAPVVDVERLSDEAGAELLRDNDVWGIDKELRQASHDFGGHPLALTLLASLIKETQNGDVRRRDHIRGLLADADNPRHDQARRVMESYEKEWLAGQPILLAILHCVGLFDRPGERRLPQGATHEARDPRADRCARRPQRRAMAARRRALARGAAAGAGRPLRSEALDAHPLVREWFGERLRQTNEAAWKAAHSRLYDHLRARRTKARRRRSPISRRSIRPSPTAAALGDTRRRLRTSTGAAFAAVGRTAESNSMRSTKWAPVGSDLAAISWFFDRPYETPAAALAPADRALVLSVSRLRIARARATPGGAARDADGPADVWKRLQDWSNAASAASNLSETALLLGDVAAAAGDAEKSVALADRGGDAFVMIVSRTTQADALHAAGEWEEAARSVRRRRAAAAGVAAGISFAVFSCKGIGTATCCCRGGEPDEARDRAAQTLESARRANLVLDIALDTLTLGRAHLALALQSLGERSFGRAAQRPMRAPLPRRLDEAVEGLRGSGQNEHVPRGLLARAAFRRAVGDWDGAARDLDEVEEIAEPGPMRLYLCDGALERARLALARREAFAPLNGLVEPSPPPPALPDAAEAARLLDGGAQGARRRAQAHRRMRLSPPRRGTRRARRRRRRPPPLRRSPAARVRPRPLTPRARG